MLGNLNFGTHALGTAGGQGEEYKGVRNYGAIIIDGLQPQVRVDRKFFPSTGKIDLEGYHPVAQLHISIYPTSDETGATQTTHIIEIEAPSPFVRIVNRVKPTTGNIQIEGFTPIVIVTPNTPTTEQYIEYIKGNFRTPIYRLELLRKEDETVRQVIEGRIVNDSGSVQISLDEGVRRTCDFVLNNADGAYNDFVENITLGDKFRLSLGYQINGVDKYYPQGIFVFDDPSIISARAQREIEISGTDKWSMLNG